MCIGPSRALRRLIPSLALTLISSHPPSLLEKILLSFIWPFPLFLLATSPSLLPSFRRRAKDWASLSLYPAVLQGRLSPKLISQCRSIPRNMSFCYRFLTDLAADRMSRRATFSRKLRVLRLARRSGRMTDLSEFNLYFRVSGLQGGCRRRVCYGKDVRYFGRLRFHVDICLRLWKSSH